MRIDRTGVLIGLFFAAAGVLFLLEALEVVDVRGAYLWPLLLIGFGVALLAGSLARETPRTPAQPAEEPPPTRELPREDTGTTELPREEPPPTDEYPRERPPEDV